MIRRDGGLTAADRTYLDGRRTSLNSDRLPHARFTPPAIISRDGTTAVLVTPLATADDVKVSDSTMALRARLAVGRPSALTVQVTGAAGVLTDLSSVFSGADVKLLAGTALLVLLLLVLIYRSPGLRRRSESAPSSSSMCSASAAAMRRCRCSHSCS